MKCMYACMYMYMCAFLKPKFCLFDVKYSLSLLESIFEYSLTINNAEAAMLVRMNGYRFWHFWEGQPYIKLPFPLILTNTLPWALSIAVFLIDISSGTGTTILDFHLPYFSANISAYWKDISFKRNKYNDLWL